MERENGIYHNWLCLQYCDTKENCLAACGLEVPSLEEILALKNAEEKYANNRRGC
jgi:hypothetical protein